MEPSARLKAEMEEFTCKGSDPDRYRVVGDSAAETLHTQSRGKEKDFSSTRLVRLRLTTDV